MRAVRWDPGQEKRADFRPPFSTLPQYRAKRPLPRLVPARGLAVNARDAMPDGGTITISASAEPIPRRHPSRLKPGKYVRLSVSDTGTGMDESTLKRAIEPFFSTKGIGKGTGLGLSMVDGLAAQLGGAMTISSQVGLGTRVDLWLRIAEQPATAPRDQTDDKVIAASGTALLVDDEELVRTSTAEMLADLGYDVVEAASAEDALQLVADGLQPQLLVTDHLMPGIDGVELAHMLHQHLPALRRLIISGYAEGEGLAPDLPRLEKPFRRADLAKALGEHEPHERVRWEPGSPRHSFANITAEVFHESSCTYSSRGHSGPRRL